jgi:hypothetical protein
MKEIGVNELTYMVELKAGRLSPIGPEENHKKPQSLLKSTKLGHITLCRLEEVY